MEYNEIFTVFADNADAEQAIRMSAYMRDQFPYLGIPTTKRRELSKAFLSEIKKDKSIDWAFVRECWDQTAREFQYLAMDYILTIKNRLTSADIPAIREIAIKKSWWDTIDGLDIIVGNIALQFPEVNKILLMWSIDENIWLRRIAIDHQLVRKEKTDTSLLETIIKNNFGQTEFFINKAIGWSLRDYSKTNPAWVRDFINKYSDKLAPLSIKEASKFI